MPIEMTMTSEVAEKFLLHVRKEIEIAAPVAVAFEAMLEEIGPGLAGPDGVPMRMKLEAWPGGRYFRDLGNNAGHLWGHVQVIKPPTLLEITGPLFMSYAVVSHVQYRLTEQGRKTLLALTHRAFGEISPDHRTGVNKGWETIIQRIRDRAQR
jgi:Activator of Hsp90 ATPase homolog 1-like protein